MQPQPRLRSSRLRALAWGWWLAWGWTGAGVVAGAGLDRRGGGGRRGAGPAWGWWPARGWTGGRRALRSAGGLPETERDSLVVDAVGEQAERPADGLVRVAAGRPDPFGGGREVIDPVGQLDADLGVRRGHDAERRAGLLGTPRAGVARGERHLQDGLVELLGPVRVPRDHRDVGDVALARAAGVGGRGETSPGRGAQQDPAVPERVDDRRAAAVGWSAGGRSTEAPPRRAR